MKALVKNNLLVLAIYSTVLAVSLIFLLNIGKVQIHVYLNQLVGNQILDNLFYYLTYLGDGTVAIVLLSCIIFYNVRLGICCTISFLAAALAANAIKYGLYDEVMRPWHVFQWYVKTPLVVVNSDDLHIHNSFPSGHATQAFAIFMCLSLFAKNNLNKLLFLAIAILTAFSRTYLSQHWLVDITVGSVLGTITAFLLFYFIVHKKKYEKLNKPLLKLNTV